MPVPVIVGAALAIGAGLGIGLPVGWKLDRYFFGEEIGPQPTINLKQSYILQTKLLQYSLSDVFLDKKIYAYYLYSLILSQQEVLINLKTQIESDSYIEYVQNTKKEWEENINFLKIKIESTLYRYLCYESLFKKIFSIPYDERNADIIREKIVPFDYLSELQFNQLNTWIINPLFNGWYDFEIKDIPVILCPEINFDNNNGCQKFIIQSFPYPELAKDEKGHFNGAYDVIMPLILKMALYAEKKLGKELMDEWFGFIDEGVSKLTGIKAGYTIKTGEKLEELKGTAADFYNNMRKEFRSFRNSLSNAYSNTSAGLSGFAEAMTIAGIGAAALLAYNVFFQSSNRI